MFNATDTLPAHISVTILKKGIFVPAGLQSDPCTIVPDEVVERCVRLYRLNAPGKRGIDPMCGVGTISRVITKMGGSCDANELDAHQYSMAASVLPASVKLTRGDCLAEQFDTKYDYIYTSVPFVWFEHRQTLGQELARAFKRMIKPGGQLILDSDDFTTRNGHSWPLALHQIAYFTAHGFRFDETHQFVMNAPASVGDTTFTEISFSLL